MTPQAFEQHLRELDRHATLIRSRTDRETWRFVFNDKPYYLHFYPQGSRFSASLAPREYAGLRTLQDFKIPAVRVVALLSGFQFGSRKGNAVITQGLEPSVRLSELSPTSSQRRVIVDQIIQLLVKLTDHELGYDGLNLSSFLWYDHQVLFLDGTGVKSEVLTTEQLMQFVHRLEPFVTRSDKLRGWRMIRRSDNDVPPDDQRKIRRYRQDLKRDSTHFIRIDSWSGWFKSAHDRPLDYSLASRLSITAEDWQREWPRLIQSVRANQLDILKSDASGDILSGQICLQGRPIDVIVKYPRNKYLYRKLFNVFRASRARRLFDKTRWLLVRRIEVEYPLIVMERSVMGYPVESVAVFEKVPGVPLNQVDLSMMSPDEREMFFRRCGRVLRRIEDTGLSHTDAKSSNWIVYRHEVKTNTLQQTTGARPILVDAYGIRNLNYFLQLFGIHRLLRAMKDHPQYTPRDSLHICQGFSPRSIVPEDQ